MSADVILNDLRAYLAGDNTVVFSPRRINEMIAAFDGLRGRINSWHVKIEKLDDEVTMLRAELTTAKDALWQHTEAAKQSLKEKEALRTELAAEQTARREAIEDRDAVAEHRDVLHAELAARDALLHEARVLVLNFERTEHGLIDRIDAALNGGGDDA